MKIAILMNQNSYAGREYLRALNSAGIKVDVLSIGNFPEYNESENDRCGGLWVPLSQVNVSKGLSVKKFDSLKDESFVNYLCVEKYDIGIQGGTGILKKNIIECFNLGILNFHPGNLPAYRGCSAPEWQIMENNSIICTCHLVDEGIDSGDIYKKKRLNINLTTYHTMRASIYPQISDFLVEILSEIIQRNGFVYPPQKQEEKTAKYRPYIGQEKINYLIQILKERSLHE